MSARAKPEPTVRGGNRLKEVLAIGAVKDYQDYFDNALRPRTFPPDGLNTRRGYRLPAMPEVEERMTDWEFGMRQQSTTVGVLPDDARSLQQQLAAYTAEATLRNASQFMSEYEFLARTQSASNVLALDLRPAREQKAAYARELLLRQGQSVNLP